MLPSCHQRGGGRSPRTASDPEVTGDPGTRACVEAPGESLPIIDSWSCGHDIGLGFPVVFLPEDWREVSISWSDEKSRALDTRQLLEEYLRQEKTKK